MTDQEKQYIQMQEQQIAVLEKKRPALEKLRDSYQILSKLDLVKLMQDFCPGFAEYAKSSGDAFDLKVALTAMCAGLADMYAQELITMDQIKANFQATKAKLEGPRIAIPRTKAPDRMN
jgi:hypothetical protein